MSFEWGKERNTVKASGTDISYVEKKVRHRFAVQG